MAASEQPTAQEGDVNSKQERAARREKKAAEQAAAVVEQAVTKVKGKRQAVELDTALADRVKELRDGGMAWWKIGHELQLPGSADNVTHGKGGASRARALYKKAFGDYPHVQRTRKAPDESLASAEGTHKRNREGHEVVKAVAGKPVFADGVTDEEVVTAIQGKKITWNIYQVNPITGKREFVQADEQIVHEGAPITIKRDSAGFRYVSFREGQGHDVPVDYRGMAGKYRAVLIHEIVKVAGTGRRVQTEEVKEAAAERAEVKKTRRAARRKPASS